MDEISELPTLPGWGPYDWQQVLGKSYPRDGEQVTLGQVYKVWAMYSSDVGGDGYNDTDLAALVELQNGDWATVHAGNDTTGWGCHGDYVDWRIFKTKAEAISQGLTSESRRWLKLTLDTDQDAGEVGDDDQD
jgi:hypothetical protein